MTVIEDFLRSFLVRSKALPLILVSIGICACNGSPDPIPWGKIIPNNEKGQITAPARSSNHLVVYLDVSGSMAGYVGPNGKINFAASPDGQTVFSHTLQELRNVVTTLNPSVNVVVRRIASRVEQPSFSDLELSQASLNRGFYIGAETNLAGAINVFSQPLKSSTSDDANDQNGDPEEPQPARFHVLVTDGVQSTNQQRADISCTSGSDYVCVKKSIHALLEKGWAGTVVGIRSEFQGKVYSELKPGESVDYQSKKSDPKTFRPFYLFIFSPERGALDKFVETLKTKLRPIVKQEETLREYPLTADYSVGWASAEVLIPKESSDYFERTKAREENPSRLTLRINLDTERRGPQSFSMAVAIPWSGHAKDSATSPELAGLMKWELVEVQVDSSTEDHPRLPEVKLTGHQVDEQGRSIVLATGQWPQGTGSPGWRAYRLVGRLNLEKQMPPWVTQWSTNVDTTADVANRTLNLESALANLWLNPFMEQQVVAEAYLRVGPQ